MNFDFGNFRLKGQRIATGQANIKSYKRELCELISAGNAKLSEIISHELLSDEAPKGYKHFDTQENGFKKVILKLGKTKSELKDLLHKNLMATAY
ncbi:MAG: hypothetical protein WKG06_04260 [Segetibacter sp.]